MAATQLSVQSALSALRSQAAGLQACGSAVAGYCRCAASAVIMTLNRLTWLCACVPYLHIHIYLAAWQQLQAHCLLQCVAYDL